MKGINKLNFKKGTKVAELSNEQLQALVDLRTPQSVVVADYRYASCPTCGAVNDREGVEYCSHCGQRLNWSKFYAVLRNEERGIKRAQEACTRHSGHCERCRYQKSRYCPSRVSFGQIMHD